MSKTDKIKFLFCNMLVTFSFFGLINTEYRTYRLICICILLLEEMKDISEPNKCAAKQAVKQNGLHAIRMHLSPILITSSVSSLHIHKHSSTLRTTCEQHMGEILCSQYTGPIHSRFNPLCALCLIWSWLILHV